MALFPRVLILLPNFFFVTQGIAKRLVKEALKNVVRKCSITYEELKKVDKGLRRRYHDDITVVVLFLDHELLNEKIVVPVPELSLRAFVDTAGPSRFNIFQERT